MISEWFLQIALGFTVWLADALTFDVPDPSTVFGPVAGIVQGFASMGVWINWAALGVAIAASLGTWAACLGIKSLRAVAAHVPVVGGAG